MRTEKIVGVFVIIGLFMKFNQIIMAGMLLILALSTLSMLYFPFGFYFFSDKEVRRQNIVLSIVSGLCFAPIPLGILFKTMFWPGANLQLISGVGTSIGILLIVVFLRSKREPELTKYYESHLLRTSVLLVFGLFFLCIPQATLIKIQHRDDPEMVRLKTRYFSDQQNEEYKREYLEYEEAIFKKEMEDAGKVRE